MIHIQIQSIELKKLTLLENNPRTIKKDQMAKLCKSIQDDPDFLYSRPVLVHDTGEKLEVYAGNQRVRAAKKLKWKEIPCIIEKDLSEEKMKARVVKDNKTYGEFDFDMLAGDYEIEELVSYGFDMKELGIFSDNVEEIQSKDKKEKPKQLNMCPACGCEY